MWADCASRKLRRGDRSLTAIHRVGCQSHESAGDADRDAARSSRLLRGGLQGPYDLLKRFWDRGHRSHIRVGKLDHEEELSADERSDDGHHGEVVGGLLHAVDDGAAQQKACLLYTSDAADE